MRRFVLLALVIAFGISVSVASAGRDASASSPRVSSLTSAPVTIYGAKWCSACRSLENGLKERKITFDIVDVDDNPGAFARARAASGAGGSIPLSSVVRTSGTVWIVGADVDAVDRAQRSE